MAKPAKFAFSIQTGDPVRLATALQGIVAALEPLNDAEAGDVLRAVVEMYEIELCGAVAVGQRGVTEGARCRSQRGHSGDHQASTGAMWSGRG